MVQDRIYSRPLETVADFQFDDRVAAVFADMIKRSVPGYEHITAMLQVLAARFAAPNSRLYDLGCSLGAGALALAAGAVAPGCRVVAVDNSPAMIERCREHAAASTAATPVDAVCADLREVKFERASVVVLNFTLQFIPVTERDDLLARIFAGMLPDGVLVLSEKITHEDPLSRELLIAIYHDWKRSNGYSELEISQKRTALENVLFPETLAAHRARLERVGFQRIEPWFQCFNFLSLLAIK